MLTCKNCFGGLRFDPKKQKLVCDYCDSEFTAEEYKEQALISAEEQQLSAEEAEFFKGYITEEKKRQDATTYKAYLMTCPQCGGELLTTEETAATFCSYCGSSVVLQSRITRERRPSYIIPFSKTKEDCERVYRNAVKKALYAPTRMLQEEQIERFRGIYMPYWVYSFDKKGTMSFRGEKSHRRGDYIYTKHYSLKTQVDASYKGLAYDASSSFADNLSEAIAPFDFHEAKPFDPAYLSGFYADTHDVKADLYEEDAKKTAKDHVARELSKQNTFFTYGVSQSDIADKATLKTGKTELAMYPVWFLATRNKKGDRVSYAVVNGQTGEVAADLPIDMKKLFIGTAVLTVPLFLIFTLLFTMTPTKSVGVTLVFALIGCLAAVYANIRAVRAEERLDDRGYMSVYDPFGTEAEKKKAQKEAARKEKAEARKHKQRTRSAADKTASGEKTIRPFWKTLVAFILCIAVLVLHPVADMAYYVMDILCVLMVAWSFLDIFKIHNRVSSRPLPQFGKRGGDENGEH